MSVVLGFLLLGPLAGLVALFCTLLQEGRLGSTLQLQLLGYKTPLRPHRNELWIDVRQFWTTVFIVQISTVVTTMLFEAGYTKLYVTWSYRDLWYVPVTTVVLLLWHDAFMYFSHRLMHHPMVFKYIHKHHHESKVLTAWTALSFSPGEAIIYIVGILAPVLIFPIHVSALMLFLSVAALWGLISHIGSIRAAQRRYRHLEQKRRTYTHGFLIGSFYHDYHHKLLNSHFGMYFTFWDSLLKTESNHYSKEFRA